MTILRVFLAALLLFITGCVLAYFLYSAPTIVEVWYDTDKELTPWEGLFYRWTDFIGKFWYLMAIAVMVGAGLILFAPSPWGERGTEN